MKSKTNCNKMLLTEMSIYLRLSIEHIESIDIEEWCYQYPHALSHLNKKDIAMTTSANTERLNS